MTLFPSYHPNLRWADDRLAQSQKCFFGSSQQMSPQIVSGCTQTRLLMIEKEGKTRTERSSSSLPLPFSPSPWPEPHPSSCTIHSISLTPHSLTRVLAPSLTPSLSPSLLPSLVPSLHPSLALSLSLSLSLLYLLFISLFLFGRSPSPSGGKHGG